MPTLHGLGIGGGPLCSGESTWLCESHGDERFVEETKKARYCLVTIKPGKQAWLHRMNSNSQLYRGWC